MSEPPAKKRSRRTAPEPSPVPAKPPASKRATPAPADGHKPARRGSKAAEATPEAPLPAPEPPAVAPPEPAAAHGLSLASLVESMPEAFFCVDSQWHFTYVSPRMCELLGQPGPALLGKDLRTHCHELLALREHLSMEQPSTEQPPARFQYFWPTREAFFDVRVRTVDSGLLVHLRDITSERRSQEELRLALEAAQVGIWDWELQAGRIRWSDNIDSILGGVPGGPGDTYEAFLQRVLAEDQTLLAQKVAAAMQSLQDFDAEFRVYVPSGAPRWMRAKVRVLSEHGQARRMLGTLKDITREQQVEEESRRAADFQEQLIGIVSHDIRSPLGAIISWARIMALGGPPPEEQQRTFRRITSAALRIERLTRLLLDFARARLGGGITLEPRRCDLHELLQKVSHEFRIAYPDRTMQCDQEGEPTVGTWDPDRLAQVVSNLVENALKYSPPDTLVRLTAKGKKEHVVLEVHNQGKPVPPELLPHIFEPFRRGPQSSRTAKTSYGLGLYIVQEIVLAHGGTIDVRSDIEEGTTFTVSLPRVPPAALEMMRRPSPSLPKNG